MYGRSDPAERATDSAAGSVSASGFSDDGDEVGRTERHRPRRGDGTIRFADGVLGSPDATASVLHVDDDPAFLEMTKSFLERNASGLDVRTESDVTAALSDGFEGIDCLVSDFDMPAVDGLEFLDRVRRRRPELPFILFTGKGSEEIASEAISSGVTDYLQKGVGTDQFDVLANRVGNAVAGYRSERALSESRRRLSTLVAHLPGMVYRCAPESPWNMEFVGGDVTGVMGRTPASFLDGTVTFGELIHDDDVALVDDVVREAITVGRSYEIEYRVHVDGSVKRVRENGEPVFEGGSPVALEGYISDAIGGSPCRGDGS